MHASGRSTDAATGRPCAPPSNETVADRAELASLNECVSSITKSVAVDRKAPPFSCQLPLSPAFDEITNVADQESAPTQLDDAETDGAVTDDATTASPSAAATVVGMINAPTMSAPVAAPAKAHVRLIRRPLPDASRAINSSPRPADHLFMDFTLRDNAPTPP